MLVQGAWGRNLLNADTFCLGEENVLGMDSDDCHQIVNMVNITGFDTENDKNGKFYIMYILSY